MAKTHKKVTKDPCPACGSMLYKDGTCSNIACESYDSDDSETDI